MEKNRNTKKENHITMHCNSLEGLKNYNVEGKKLNANSTKDSKKNKSLYKSGNEEKERSPKELQNKNENKNMKVPNIHYFFYVQYYEGLNIEFEIDKDKQSFKIKNTDSYKDKIMEKNKRLFEHEFLTYDPYTDYDEIKPENKTFCKIALKTIYPGLMMGTGISHDVKLAGALKVGFSFDYVTGLPYLPGSSLKGVLRSYFPKQKNEFRSEENFKEEIEQEKLEYIVDLIAEISQDEVDKMNKDEKENFVFELKKNIFDFGDVFLDSYPNVGANKENRNEDADYKKLITSEYITPHRKNNSEEEQNDKNQAISPLLKNPIPISMLKVKPEIEFDFSFLLKNFCYEYKAKPFTFTAEDKCKLFKQLILDMGVGAKTNVGFGQFTDVE